MIMIMIMIIKQLMRGIARR